VTWSLCVCVLLPSGPKAQLELGVGC
jgi:hypothetical protein